MKKSFLYSSLFAAVLLTGCSTDEPVVNGGSEEGGVNHYLAINIVSVPDGNTRAAGDQTSGNPSGAIYEEGTDEENKVEKVFFYFYDASGNPVNVKAGSSNNYYEWTPAEKDNEGPVKPNIDNKLSAVLLINTQAGDNLPAQIITIINPRSTLNTKSYTIAELRGLAADYAKLANNTGADQSFPMVTSVYMDETTKTSVRSTVLTSANYGSTEKEAMGKPVKIYVERNVAKVRAKLELENNSSTVDGVTLIQLKDKKGNPLVIKNNDGEYAAYLKLAGWNITADPDLANLSKRIDTGWDHPVTGLTYWNYPEYYRSFWAASCVQSFTNQYDNFNVAKKAFGGFKYCNENAERSGDNANKESTKVMFYGTICDVNGNPLTVCEFFGMTFVDDNNYVSLKKAVLADIVSGGTYYYRKQTIDGAVKFTALNENDLDFITGSKAGDPNIKLGKDAFYVVPRLKAGIEGEFVSSTARTAADIVLDGDGKNTQPITLDALNDIVKFTNTVKKEARTAKIWNSGMTYYFAPIEHFGNIGVVRNHIYDMTVKTIAGLGTPVYDPTETIIPEKPKNEDTFIAAQVNILSWRLVSNSVNLDWTE